LAGGAGVPEWAALVDVGSLVRDGAAKRRRDIADMFMICSFRVAYLPPALAARAKYPGNVEVETLADGAALVTLYEEPFEKSDAEGMARLRALTLALRSIQS